MRNLFGKSFTYIAVWSFLLVSACDAMAQTNPACVGVTQAPAVDYSDDAEGKLCFPEKFIDGDPIPATEVFTCAVDFFDSDGIQIGSVAFTGGPASLHSFTVPEDGTGASVSECLLNGLLSDTNTVVTTFPAPPPVAPNAPVLLN